MERQKRGLVGRNAPKKVKHFALGDKVGEQGNGGDPEAIAAGQQNIRNAGGLPTPAAQDEVAKGAFSWLPEGGMLRPENRGRLEAISDRGLVGGSIFGPHSAGVQTVASPGSPPVQSVSGVIRRGSMGEQGNGGDPAAIAAGQQNLRNAGAVIAPAAPNRSAAFSEGAYGTGGVNTPSGNGQFAQDGRTYTVSGMGQGLEGIKRIDSPGQSTLFTNQDPGAAVQAMKGVKSGTPTMASWNPSQMAQRLTEMSAQRAGVAPDAAPNVGAGTSGMGVGTNAVGPVAQDPTFARWDRERMQQQMLNSLPSFGGTAAQMHTRAQMYGDIMRANTAEAANQTAQRGQDIGMQSHLQGIAMGNRTVERGQDIGLQSHLQGLDLAGKYQLGNTALAQGLHNAGQMDLARYNATSPVAQAHGALEGAQASQIQQNVAFNNPDRMHYDNTFRMVSQSPWGQMHTPQEVAEEATRIHEANKPSTVERSKALFATLTPVERQEFARTGKIPTRMQQPAVEPHADGGVVGGQGLSLYPQERPRQPEPVPEWRKSAQAAWDAIRGVRTPNPNPPPTADGLPDTVERIKNRGRQLQEIANYATGGPIDVSGRQVLDPSGEMDRSNSDSLPAMIDGDPKRPAALTSGEFVMPTETVQFYGLDRLRKMVATSRKGLDVGRRAA